MTPPDPRLRAPTLTEVLGPDDLAPAAVGAPPVVVAPPAVPMAPPPSPVDTDALTAQVLQQVQRRIDQMLEFRLREALAPMLAQTADALVQEARRELAATMRDVVQRAVAQEISRHRGR
jgi:hypothetical protein